MSSPITFGKEAEGLYRALSDVLLPSFSAAATLSLDGVSLPVGVSSLIFGNEPMPDSPAFSFTLTGCTQRDKYKREKPAGSSAKFGFLSTSDAIVAVHFRCANKVADSAVEGNLFAYRQWGVLSALLNFNIKKFHDNGIAKITFDAQPVRLPGPSHVILFGVLEFETEVHHSVNLT